MYRTCIQRIEIALLSDPWCIQITLTVERKNTDKYKSNIIYIYCQRVRVQWCMGQKRGGGGGGGGGRVELPDSLVDEAVLQSAGPRLETPQSPP